MQVTSPKCPNCGANILDPNARFCAHCGSAIVVSNPPQSLPTATSLLELGKSLLTAGNFQEADKQFILALRIEPDNKEVWLWRGVCTDTKTCWEKSSFPREQIVQNLANLIDGKQLLAKYSEYLPITFPIILNNEAQAAIFLDASLQAQRERPSRKDYLRTTEHVLLCLSRVLHDFYWHYNQVSFRESDQEKARGYCTGLMMLFDRLGSDQPGDAIEGDIISKGGGFFGDPYSERQVREKPSYWCKYVQQTIAKFSKE